MRLLHICGMLELRAVELTRALQKMMLEDK
jgi:hypothetical protein